MDNSILLLILVKKRVNLSAFIDWYKVFYDLHTFVPNYEDYVKYYNQCVNNDTDMVYQGCVWTKKDYQILSYDLLNSFEFGFIITSLSLYNLI